MQASGHTLQRPEANAYLELQAEQIRCIVELRLVEKIFLLPRLTAIPEAPGYLAGVLNYHGCYVPVIDLAIRLGQEVNNPYTEDTLVVLVNCPENAHLIGLIVTGVGQVQDISYGDFQLVEQCSGKALPFIAIVNHENELFLALNTETLLSTSLSSLNAATYEDINKLVHVLMN